MPADHLRAFAPLIGTWKTVAHTSRHWEGSIDSGETTFEWALGGQFLRQTSVAPDPFPSGELIVGARSEGGSHPGAGSGDTLAHYFDSRGVFRVYVWSFEDGVWRQGREEPGFDQRFEGVLSNDQSRIEAKFFMRNEGDWFVDFHVDYTRVG